MKVLSTILLVVVICSSCKKKNCCEPIGSIEGTWRMVLVKDNATGAVMLKPGFISRDVIISFVASGALKGSFNGTTPSNVFGPDGYTLGNDQAISMPVMTMTKVGENAWGRQFVDNIRNADKYQVSGQRLNIRTVVKTLSFQRQ